MFVPSVGNVYSHALNDGRTVGIRPIRPDDQARLRAFHSSLSPDSQYRRFLGTKPQLSAADARYLADIDGCDHVALVATGPADPGEDAPIVAVARFIRLSDTPDTAEFAIVVGDSYQRRGLAEELMARLAEAGRERGISRFRASMLAENVAIRRLMVRLAQGPVEILQRGPVVELEIELAAGLSARASGSARRARAMIAGWAGS